MRDSFRLLILVLYCLEGGFLLSLMPWTQMWPDLYYFRRFPALAPIGAHPVTRGVVSAIGLLLLLYGLVLSLAAVRDAWRQRRRSALTEVGR